MPYFSIIIPTLNSSNTVTRALGSILSQSFTDFEVLIMDGLSFDTTIGIAKGFNDERIRIYSEKDNGIYDAMNKGIKLTTGDWVYFLGSDDVLFDSDVLQHVVNVISNSNCDVIYGDVFSSRYNGSYDGEFTALKILGKNICHQAIFFNKIIFERVGLFNLRYKSHADWDHNMRWFFSKTIKNNNIDLVIANYADGGFSSLNNDSLFVKEKVLKYLLYAKRQVSFKTRLTLLVSELLKKVQTKDINLFIKYLLNTPRIILGI